MIKQDQRDSLSVCAQNRFMDRTAFGGEAQVGAKGALVT